MRRLFIIRKDLNMSPGKLSTQISHCAEAYWTRIIADSINYVGEKYCSISFCIDKEIMSEYVGGILTKTVCEAKSKTHLLKAKDIARELNLNEGTDYGLIYDKCLTELDPEEEDGTTLTGIWFRPLPDDISHKISKKYQLYKGDR